MIPQKEHSPARDSRRTGCVSCRVLAVASRRAPGVVWAVGWTSSGCADREAAGECGHFSCRAACTASVAAPSVPSFPDQWALNNTGQLDGKVDADIDAPEAWDVFQGSLKTVVAVVDTGIDYRHPDLYKNIWLNQGEIPSDIRSRLVDTDGDS